MKLFCKIDRKYGQFLTIIDAFTAFMVFALMILITCDVISRTALDHPFQGVSEIVSNAIIVLCFLEIPYVSRKGSHVRSTMVYDKLGVRGKAIVDLVACLLGIAVYVFVIYSSWGNFVHAAAINDAEIAGTVRIPTTPGRFSIILGSSLMCLEFLFQCIKNLVRMYDTNAFSETSSGNVEGGAI